VEIYEGSVSLMVRALVVSARWAAVAPLETEKNFPNIIGCRDLWTLKAALDDDQTLDGSEISAVDDERLAA